MNNKHDTNDQHQDNQTPNVNNQKPQEGDAATPPTYENSITDNGPLDALEKSSDGKQLIQLHGDDRLLGTVAAEFGTAMAVPKQVFNLNAGVYYYSKGEFRPRKVAVFLPLKADVFRTYCEKYIIGYRIKDEKLVAHSLSREDAAGILASEQFLQALPVLERVNSCRLPVYRDTKIELLPVGYDEDTRIFTVPEGPEYSTKMPLGMATQVINEVFEEFKFTEPARSLSVLVAGMVGLYVAPMLPLGILKPCFTILANGEGAGKTLGAKCMVSPVLGAIPTGIKADREEEIEKRITTIVREAGQVMFLDNVRGYFNSQAVEALLSCEIWTGRKLGQSASIVGPNTVTVIVTGNGLTVNPDLRRRSLFIELVLDCELAEQRKFKRILDDGALKKLRPALLAALWALVRNWDTLGRPKPSNGHSAFPVWAELVGGIVEAAGFKGCFDPPATIAVLDSDGEDIRRLTAAMPTGDEHTFNELLRLAAKLGCFERVIGATSDFDEGGMVAQKLSHSQTSKLGILLRRYNGRQIGNGRFVITGDGHAKRFKIAPLTAS